MDFFLPLYYNDNRNDSSLVYVVSSKAPSSNSHINLKLRKKACFFIKQAFFLFLYSFTGLSGISFLLRSFGLSSVFFSPSFLCSSTPIRLTQPVTAKIITVVRKSPEISEAPARVELKIEGRRATVAIRKKRSGLILTKPAAQVSRSFGVPGIKKSRKEMMKVHFSMSSSQRQKRCQELLERVGLPREMVSRFPHELSGGQRQRIGIARALATEPKFIVCDEPIAALDSSIQAQVINLLMDLQKELGLTYLFISHDLSMVRHISDRICIMYLGSVVELADAQQIDENPVHPYTRALFSAVPQIDNADWSSKRIKLEGEIPNPINAPKGCKFCTRCMWAKPVCQEQAPELEEIEPGHFVACHFCKEMLLRKE